MSPEQVQGRAVDGRSDQFSLGVMAFEMLTGEKPYTGENLTTVAYKIVSEEPVPPHRLNPTLAGSIDGVLRRALSKKPDSRFRTCQEFSDALERACAATAGWRTMPRGGSLNEPTVNQPRTTPTLPPARRPVRRDGPATGEHTSRKSAMLTFILLILAAAGLLALVGTRALPWLNPKIEIPKSEPRVEAPPPVETPKPQVPPPAAPDPADEKPSPMPVPPEKKESASAAQPETALTPARITVISSPGGATATLDGRESCTTPCSLDAAPGRHSVSLVLPGYQVERRDVTLAAEREIELPIVVMRNTSGTVMLSSVPNGAAVMVNGRRTGQTTPVQLVLAPGTYSIGVEKDGRQAVQTVEVRNGLTSLRIQLGQ
jgi:serine/threonine protein kinase